MLRASVIELPLAQYAGSQTGDNFTLASDTANAPPEVYANVLNGHSAVYFQGGSNSPNNHMYNTRSELLLNVAVNFFHICGVGYRGTATTIVYVGAIGSQGLELFCGLNDEYYLGWANVSRFLLSTSVAHFHFLLHSMS